ncbi:MAG: Meiotic Sister-Chromatid recombination aldehyde dehydrogenase [Claussenomyces sp. TS43310]|nr:MAG: Meiotic Sister-Chromatid recombination aldehyde dehydrogenase [Claussenomyces sp. TS43310]
MIVLWSAAKCSEFLGLEPPKKYTVPVPRIPEQGEAVKEPSMKVSGSSAIRCYAPATGRYLGLIIPSTPAGIDRAVERAHAAQKIWATTSFDSRRQVLATLLQFVLKNQDEICRIASLDSGKTMIDASLGEILVTAEKLRWTINHGEKSLRPSRRPTNILMMYKTNEVRYEPLGVVAALVSWNYPFHNLLGPIISAIFAGNGIVVKASENTAWSASYFTSIVRGALSVCGHDPSLVQSVVCWPQTANHLTSHPGISHITFIGSRQVAHKVASSAAKALIPVLAELGGKDAAIVLDSAKSDLPRVAEILLRGTFQASGQNCIGIERIIACPAVYDTLISILEPRIKALRVGSVLDASPSSPIDVGAMVTSASFERLENLILSAVNDGARLLVGGSRLKHSKFPYGHYFQPTLIVDVTPEMVIANEECFAPICVLMRAESPKHAVEIANKPDFGLGASVFGKVPSLLDWSGEGDATMEVAAGVKSGMVSINDFAVYYAVQLPFGGVGGSGYGRFAGEEGLRGLCNPKSVCRDRWNLFGIRTAIPKGMRYPIPDTSRGFAFASGVVEMGYGISLWDKLRGLGNLMRNS